VTKHADLSAKDDLIENEDKINAIFREDGSIQDIFRSLHADDSEFSQGVLKKLKYMSPLSMAVVFEQIKRG
jgi:hypothetical protein